MHHNVDTAWWDLLLEKPTESGKTPTNQHSSKSPLDQVGLWWVSQIEDESGVETASKTEIRMADSNAFTAETQKLLCRLDGCNATENMQTPVLVKLGETLDAQMKKFSASFFGKSLSEEDRETVNDADELEEGEDSSEFSEDEGDSSTDNSSISTQDQHSLIFSSNHTQPFGNENGLMVPSKYRKMIENSGKRKKLRRKKHIVGAEIKVPSVDSSLHDISQQLLSAQQKAQQEIVSNRYIMMDEMSEVALLSGQFTKKDESKSFDSMTKEYKMDTEVGKKSCISFSSLKKTSKIGIFKKLGLSHSGESSGTLPTAKNSTFDSSMLQLNSTDSTQSAFEPDSNKHAFLAYYKRGQPPRKSVRFYEHPIPKRFPTISDEIVVRIEASTVSTTDCAIRRGEWWCTGGKYHLSLPIVPGTSFVGTVVQADENKSGLNIGDRVCSLVRVGANARHISVGHQRLVKVPLGINRLNDVACLPELYLSAFQAIQKGRNSSLGRYKKNALANTSILVLNASSAVTIAVIQVAHLLGVSSIYATTDEQFFNVVEKAGAVPLPTEPYHWFSILKGRMNIVIVESASSMDEPVSPEYMQVLKSKGRMVVIGSPETQDASIIHHSEIFNRTKGVTKSVLNFNVFESWERDSKQAKRDLAFLLEQVGYGRLSPRVIHQVPLNAVSKMHALLESRKVPGAIVCRPWRSSTMDSLADQLSHLDGSLLAHENLAVV